METKIGKNREDIALGAELIRRGELVAFPTETVYGLGGNALDKDASKKIYAVKGRPSDNPLIVHLTEWKQVKNVAYPTAEAKALFDAFCPGPLTMILKKLPIVPDETTGGRNTVALRFPSHPVARELIALSGVPIAAPSANVSKHVSPTSASHVFDDLDGRIPLILDGGNSEVGIESTIVDLTAETPTVLRPGAITKEMIESVLGKAQNFSGEIKEALAPGMKYKHYSPRVPCYLSAKKRIEAALALLAEKGIEAVLIARGKTIAETGAKNFISLGDSPKEAQNRVYAALRDAEKFEAAIIEELPAEEGYFAAMDRIKKATGGLYL
ncbi:MAG: threonylcarbamoyl-AMP synthase [Clostridia bacterium]|nr:threonylcarbamoyl-AMP synthase [Clostridia bacterium]